jgi:hypothetical protein
MCLSRRRKADIISFRSCIQTLENLTHFMTQKPNRTPAVQSVHNQSRTETGIQNTVVTKPYVEMSPMSNQQKSEFVSNIFWIRSFWEVMAKFHQKPILYRKVWSARNAASANNRVSNCRNSQIANRLEPFNGPWEIRESFLPKWYAEP